MIVPMKKVTIITQEKDANSAIKQLGGMGVLHVEHERLPKSGDINALKDDIELLAKAINILKRGQRPFSGLPENDKKKGAVPFCRHVVDLHDRLERMEEYKRSTEKSIAEWEPWEDFDPAEIKSLSEKGVHVQLYRVPVKNIKDFPSSSLVRRLSVKKGMANCAVISRERVEIPFEELVPPKIGIRKMRARLSEDNKIVESIKSDLEKQERYLNSLMDVKKSLEKDLEFQKALDGMGKGACELVYLKGFIPHDSVNSLLKTAKEERWGISIKNPVQEDKVPTLIRNPRWVSIISPVFKMLEVVPGYRELDISLWFLIFLSVFFGMLIGDAGYGVIFFGLTLIFHKKLGKKVPSKAPFILFYTLSLFAIIWGVLTGTFFGQAWIAGIVKPLMPALRDSKNVQGLCFFIGAFHLSIAHLWRAIIKLPSPKSLADVGWVSILWGAFFLAKTLILGEAFPSFGKWFFIAGPVLIVLFTNLNRNIIKGIASGFGSLLLNVVNSFTDVVSYIRLFAVGLATVAIADAFNKMAMGIGYNSVLTALATSLILLIGHSLNILLGPLAVLVHGVRLNVLEFCNHVDIKWSGFLYKPLKNIQDTRYNNQTMTNNQIQITKQR